MLVFNPFVNGFGAIPEWDTNWLFYFGKGKLQARFWFIREYEPLIAQGFSNKFNKINI